MKLLRVIRDTRLESGGPVQGLLDSSEALIRDGHEVEVVSLDSAEEASSRNFLFPVIGLGRGWGRYGYNPQLMTWVRENARRFDAVVLHGLWNYSSFGAWRGLRNQRIPYYVFTHGMIDPWFRRQYPLKHVAKLLYWWMVEGRVLQDAAAVLFTSEEERIRARGVFYGHTYNERVVGYGIADPAGDVEGQRRAFFSAFPELQGKRFLLFLSRIHPKKGCELLIRGFAQISKHIPTDIQLAIAGPGPAGFVGELKRLAHNLGIADRTQWLGMLKADIKWGALRSAEAFILPSHQENFGIAVVEAMACSTPVLISDKVNIWQEIEASGGGFVEPDTASGAQNLLRRFYALTAEERMKMGTAARNAFLKRFDSHSTMRDFVAAIGFAARAPLVQPEKKKVLQIIRSTDKESGGPIEALLRISEVLIRAGHQVELACLESSDEVASRHFPFPAIGLGCGKGKYGYNPQYTKWIRENASRFDAAILHGLWNYSSVGAWLALRKQSTPYYIYSHGMMDPWFRDNYPLKHIAKQVFWRIAEGRVLQDAKGVLFTCEEERVKARGVFKAHPYREQVLSFGTADPGDDAEHQENAFRSAFPSMNGRPFLLFLGRIHPKKGCDHLIHAFAKTVDQISPDLQIMIAGPDPVGWMSELRTLAKKLGVANRMHWPGMVEGELKWGALRSAQAMILPSHQENFGIVVAESMACSTPVLISDKVNIWREVVSSEAGLVEPDTLEGTRNLIRKFSSLSEEERSRMKRSARRGFLKHFAIEATSKDLLRLFESES